MTQSVASQWTGCLLGQCLGDALGAPVEGRPPAVCREYVDEVLRPGRAATARRGRAPFGQYTDDSQLARELLQSYQRCRGFVPADYAARIAAIFAEGRIYGCGRATLEAAGRLQRGVPWDQAGTRPPAAGNGTAMRAGPVGLLFADDPAGLIQAAHQQGYITHQDPRCSAGSVAIAGAVALALRGGAPRPDEFLGQLSTWAATYDDSVAAALRQLVPWLALPPDEALAQINALTTAPDPAAPAAAGSDRWAGISPFVTPSVLWSLYSFLRTPADYFETVCTAIAVGGDVDTTAAMAGAISGAHLGLGALPADLLPHLTDMGTWGQDELIELAEDCHAIWASPRRSWLDRLLRRG